MLGKSTVSATLAVSNIEKGKEFYGGTLGLEQVMEVPGGVMYKSGDGTIFIYESDTAGSGKATSATWSVDDVALLVKSLQDKGVNFETYDMPGVTWDGVIAVMEDMKSAWFTDPDGNILNLAQA